jgi:hypothetical protein
MATARNAPAWLPLSRQFLPGQAEEVTRLAPTGWDGCGFPLVRRHRMRNGAGKPVTGL